VASCGLCLVGMPLVPAADLAWDNGLLASQQDPQLEPFGGGVWDGLSWNWTVTQLVSGVETVLPSRWTNGNSALFDGTAAGEVVIATSGIAPSAIKFTGAGSSIAGSAPEGTTVGLEFLTTTSTLTVDVATSLTSTISANFLGAQATTSGIGNKLAKTGAGTLVLSGTEIGLLRGDINSNMDAGYSVEGGGELRVTGGLLKAASTLQNNRGNRTNTIGATSANNAVEFSGAGRGMTGGLTLGGVGPGGVLYGGNSLTISTPGTLASPSYRLIGNGHQVNMTSSADNSLTVSNGGYFYQSNGGGTNTWTIGTNAGADRNSIVADGGVIDRRGAAGSFVTVGAAGHENSLVVRNGGAVMPRRLAIGTAGGDRNTMTVTGAGSISYISDTGTNNAWFYVGDGSAGSADNGVTVSDGGKFNFTGASAGGDRYFGIGTGTGGANRNYFTVTGAGSSLNVNYTLPIGVGVKLQAGPGGNPPTATAGGNSNRLDILAGAAVVTTTPLYVGASVAVGGANATDNVVNLGSGGGSATTARLVVNANEPTFNASAGYDNVSTLPGNTAVLSTQTNFYRTDGIAFGALNHKGLYLAHETSRLVVDNGRLEVGSETLASGAMVSGLGRIDLDGPGFFSNPSGNFNSITTPIFGTGSLTKEGQGIIALTSPDNAYTGNTTVRAGTLSITSPFLSATSTVSIDAGGFLELDFSGINIIDTLVLGGSPVSAGVYDELSAPTYFLGTGQLQVVGGGEPVTEMAWYGNGSVAGGGGFWNATTARWFDGNFVRTWIPEAEARFGTAGGIVIVDPLVGISAGGGLDFEVDGYSLQIGTLTLSAAENVVRVAASATATIDAELAGTNGFTKTGAGTLVLGGDNPISGQTSVAAGTLEVIANRALASSPVTIGPAATLAIAQGITFESPAVTLAGGTLSAGVLAIDASSGIESLTINSGTLAGSPAVTVGAGGSIELASGARVVVGVGSLAVDTQAGGLIDLGAGGITIEAGGIAAGALRDLIIAGRGNGSWNGTAGITSDVSASSAGRAVGYRVDGDGSGTTAAASAGAEGAAGK